MMSEHLERAVELGVEAQFHAIQRKRAINFARYQKIWERAGDRVRNAAIRACGERDNALATERDILLGYWPSLHDFYRSCIKDALDRAAKNDAVMNMSHTEWCRRVEAGLT